MSDCKVVDDLLKIMQGDKPKEGDSFEESIRKMNQMIIKEKKK